MNIMTQPINTAASRSGQLIAVGSGKGGVGKTWFSITLAHALARRGRKILMFDGDLGLANADIQLGLMPKHDLNDVISGTCSIDAAMMRIPDAGFDILPGRSGTASLANLPAATLDHVLAALRQSAGGFDDVIMDLGAGIDPSVRRMTAFADIVLLVITEDPSSLTDAYAVLKLLKADRPDTPLDVRIVVNQASSVAAGKRAYGSLARAARGFLRLDPPLLGLINRDERVSEAIRRQSLLLTRAPQSTAAADIETIARRLSNR
jgi:flagellar biosynthesis protein FlhG